MIYVGVQNSLKKSELASRPPVRHDFVPPEDLAWDCDRHIRFLETWSGRKARPGNMLESEYARWLEKVGRNRKAVLEKCRKFLRLFENLGSPPVDFVWATVTEDGIRLDGSHRAAAAVVLGKALVLVGVVAYAPGDEEWRSEVTRYRDGLIREVAESIG